MKTNGMFKFLRMLAPLVCAGANAIAAVVSFDQPTMDVWVYENAFNAGTRENAPIFGGPVGTGNGSDDRLGQMVMGWNTSVAGIPTGLPLDNYQITRVTFKATHVNDEVFRYDSTYDGFASYLDAVDPDFVADADTGRPIELYGVGLRNGYTDLAVSGSVSGTHYGEGSGFAVGTGEHTRNAFAWSPGSPRADGDVSESISEKFESTPFAIGINADLDAGELVPAETEFTFELNLANPGILNYLRQALHDGALGLALSSLHPSSQPGQGGQTYPRFYTREYAQFLEEVVPQLQIEYSIVPEPSAGRIMIIAAALLAMARGWRRRDRFS
jgi:hypothetical protein